MANETNLIPMNERTKSEQRKIAQMGGIASGESRRRRKALRQSMNELLSLPVLNAKDREQLRQIGVETDDADNSQVLVLSLFNRAKDGDVAAFKEIRGLIGEMSDDSKLDKLDELLEEFRDATKR